MQKLTNPEIEVQVLSVESGGANYVPLERKRSHQVKQKCHNKIEEIIAWAFVPIAWILSLGSALVKNLMSLSGLICGVGFMGWSLFLSIENYFLLFNKQTLGTAILKIFFGWNFLLVGIAIVLAIFVEKIQSDGWQELRRAKKLGATTGRGGVSGTKIFLFVLATALEAIALIFSFASRGGFTSWNLILGLVSLFGYKLGSGLVSNFAKGGNNVHL